MPFANARPGNVVSFGNTSNGRAVLHVMEGRKDRVHRVGLAGKNIARQNALACLAVEAIGQADGQDPMLVLGVDLPRNPGDRECQL